MAKSSGGTPAVLTSAPPPTPSLLAGPPVEPDIREEPGLHCRKPGHSHPGNDSQGTYAQQAVSDNLQ